MNGGDVGTRELLAALQQRQGEISDDLRQLQSLVDKHAAERRRLEVARRQALAATAAAILPALTTEALARATRLSGLTPLVQEDPLGALAADRRRLEARAAEIDADPRYRDRELQRAPRVGQLTRQIDELEEFSAPFADVMARAAHPRLEHLLEVGYGSDTYEVGWWRMSYYRDWKAGDEILEKFPQMKSFAEVRAEVLRARDTLGVYEGKLKALREEVAAGEALEHEREAIAAALPALEADHLARWRSRLVGHLETLEPQALGDRLQGEPDVELQLKQAYGLGRKIAYLDGIVENQVLPMRQQLQNERRQNEHDQEKYRRPKNYGALVPRDKFERRFRDRPAKLRKGWQRTSGAYQTVRVFDRWDRGRLIDDFLWWDLMTDGRLDGDFIPEVRDFRQAHPDWQRTSALSEHDESAAAAAAAAAHDARSDMLVDAS